MKKTIRLISCILMMMLVTSTVACGKDSATVQTEAQTEAGTFKVEDLYGTWKGTDGEISTLTLDKNGKYMDDAGSGLYISGTFVVNETTKTMTVYESDYGMVFYYNMSVSGDTMTLQLDGGLPRKFVKTK